MPIYNRTFFSHSSEGRIRSAAAIAPLIVDLLKPSSLVDVGCGLGTFLKAFKACGVSDVLGIDGPYIRPAMLAIDAAEFRAHDLRNPLCLDRRFDVAVCLEVAEHLPKDRAESFVRDLSKLADRIVFSAAPPFQGGDGHINLQPPAYWTKLFSDEGFTVVDCLRPILWNNEKVSGWYSQNMLLFIRNPAEIRALERGSFAPAGTMPLHLVHPVLHASASQSWWEKRARALCARVGIRPSCRLRRLLSRPVRSN